MSGNRYLLDTNAVIYLLKGLNEEILNNLNVANWVGISVITYLEFLSFYEISNNDKLLFENFVKRVNIFGITIEDIELLKSAIHFRKKYSIKLPDTIIASTAYNKNAILITWDQQMNRIEEINTYPRVIQ